MAPFAVRADPDGITLFLFSSPTKLHPKFTEITSPQKVEQIFSKEQPGGSTDLAGVLDQAFKDHFKKGHKPETILVITDGVPDSEDKVQRVIKEATFKINSDSELSVSFIQVGDDNSAGKFLAKLDDNLKGAKYDIVDQLSVEKMKGMSFTDLIQKSIAD